MRSGVRLTWAIQGAIIAAALAAVLTLEGCASAGIDWVRERENAMDDQQAERREGGQCGRRPGMMRCAPK